MANQRFRRTTAQASALVALLGAAQLAAARPPSAHALIGARIVVAPGRTIPTGTLVVRDGLVAAVGPNVAIPPDARVWDLAGKTLYPGLIDAYVPRAFPGEKEALTALPPPSGHRWVRPERDAAAVAGDAEKNAALRAAGFTTALVAPADGVVRGWSALVNLGDGGTAANLLRARVAQHLATPVPADDAESYPESLMGTTALLRQTLLDARWQVQANAAFAADRARPRPPTNGALAALADAANGRARVIFETDNVDALLAARRFAAELGLDAWMTDSGDAYQRLDELTKPPLPLIVSFAFPLAPKLAAEDDLTVDTGYLRHLREAPANPLRLLQAKLPVAWTTYALESPGKLFANVARALAAGLDADELLAGFTTTPAELLGLSGRAGTLDPGKMANFVVVDGDLFVEKPKIVATWVDGIAYPHDPPSDESAKRKSAPEVAR